MKQVLIVKPRGFCAGVVRAIDIVELALGKYGPPVYCKHAVVHNEAVVQDLEVKGAVFVETVEEVPVGAVVVFSAHGSRPEDYEGAKARSLQVVDATCPLVTRVHNEVRKYAAEGRSIIVVGHQAHVEAIGTSGQALSTGARVALVEPDQEIDPTLPKTLHNKPVAVVTQTTLSQEDIAPVIEKIQAVFPDVVVRNDICYATTNRQEAVKVLASEVDLVLVVGSDQSSNSRRLAEVSRKAGTPAYLVAAAENVPWFWVQSAQRVGVTSGASTPEHLVEEVVATLEAGGFAREEIEVVEEDISFKLPGELT